MSGIRVALKADSGNFMARCNNCISNGASPDSAFVHVKPSELEKSPWAHFILERLDNGKYVLQADSSNYAGRCNNCIPNAAYPDSLFFHVKPNELMSAPWAQFEISRLDNGKYAIKTDSGNYVARCNNCIPNASYPDSVFVHVKPDELETALWAQWEILSWHEGWVQSDLPGI